MRTNSDQQAHHKRMLRIFLSGIGVVIFIIAWWSCGAFPFGFPLDPENPITNVYLQYRTGGDNDLIQEIHEFVAKHGRVPVGPGELQPKSTRHQISFSRGEVTWHYRLGRDPILRCNVSGKTVFWVFEPGDGGMTRTIREYPL